MLPLVDVIAQQEVYGLLLLPVRELLVETVQRLPFVVYNTH